MIKKNIILYSVILLCSFGFIFIEAIDSYIIKAGGKFIVGILIPIIVTFLDKEITFKEFLKNRKDGMKNAILLGIIVFGVIIINFFLTKNIIDYSGMLDSIVKMSNSSLINLLLIDFHIIFINAFIEEFFFRGFIYYNLKENKYAVLISSVLFALYHSFMIIDWFNPLISIITLVGLVLVGIIFVNLNKKSENIYSSWFVHMAANLALNISGLILVLQHNLMSI